MLLITYTLPGSCAQETLNVFVWYEEVPDFVIKKFEAETGIKVNFSTYDSNETLYAKLKATTTPGYDVIEPSGYYVDRMRHDGMLEKLDKSKLTNYSNLNPELIDTGYDPGGNYSVPYLWGVTGIFVNKKYFSADEISGWSDLAKPKYANQLLFLNDPREAFSMALISLGYSANDENPEHLKQAYLKLKSLLPNIKIFNSEAIPSIFIDEDVRVGMAWNGDIYRSQVENPNLQFIYPKDGFVVWADTFAIPKNAPHKENAYKFLNFMLRPDIAKSASMNFGYPTANLAAQKLLPENIRNNPMIYPTKKVLKRGQYQTNVSDATLALIAKYWELLKAGG
ncbi:spermidine/putrescine ABC transporter substrate-binding protein [soil metagenome]